MRREIKIARASLIAIIGNSILAAIKITAGIISGSLAVIGDGIDSSQDVISSIGILITAKILAKPPNKHYPYGYGKAEIIATSFLSFVIFFAGAQLGISSVLKILKGNTTEIPSALALYVTLVSIFGKILLTIHQRYAAKKCDSKLLLANSKNMQNDILISTSVLIGVFCTRILELPVLDAIAGLLVSLWILYVAFDIFKSANIELMDGTKDMSIYKKVFDIIESVEGVHNPHRTRIRNIGNKIMVSADIEIDGSTSLKRAHEISHEVEIRLRENIPNIFDVSIHIEPIGDDIFEGDIGVDRESLDK